MTSTNTPVSSRSCVLRRFPFAIELVLLFTVGAIAHPLADAQKPVTTRPHSMAASKGFAKSADQALAAMQRRAGELNVQGVAVVAAFDGDRVAEWNSKMVVVGKLRVEPSGSDKGSNLLGIAYAKAAEMADTLKNSGSAGRSPLTGEFGWSGGVIARGRSGYLLAAFSGGKSEDDVEVSKAGVAEMRRKL